MNTLRSYVTPWKPEVNGVTILHFVFFFFLVRSFEIKTMVNWKGSIVECRISHAIATSGIFCLFQYENNVKTIIS